MTINRINHEAYGPENANRTVAFCHGILGSARNWRSFARRFLNKFPEWRVILVDLRNHGDSPPLPGPHTVRAAAADLVALSEHYDGFDAVIGHSFGGKVALAYADTLPRHLQQVWALDSDPGPVEGDPEEGEVPQVLSALRSIPVPLARREAVIEPLTAQGVSASIAQWMTTNLRRADDGLVWRFDLDGVEEMIRDYFTLDLWSVLEVPASDLEVHVLHALNSDRWSASMVARARASAAITHALPDSGHWVHIDNPAGLLRILAPHFR